MANLLLDPDNWVPELGESNTWDGSKYTVHSPDEYTAWSFVIHTIDGLGAAGGDVLAGSVAGGKASSQHGAMYLTAWWWSYSDDLVVQIGSVEIGDDAVDFSFDVPESPGDGYVIKLTTATSADGYWASSYYGQWVEVTPEQPDPPALPKPPHVINHVLRGYAGADSALSAWIRSEAGPLDLSGSALSVRIKSYKGHVISSYPASGTEGGEVTCTIPEEFGRLNGVGVYRFDVLDAANGVIAIGIIEVV